MIFNRGVAIVTVSRRGVETALRIRHALENEGHPSTVFTISKFAVEGTQPIQPDFTTFIQEIFPKVDALIPVMATGIIVRTIAPCLKSKKDDPAVVIVDDLGRFAISLVSGHLGGANELTRWVSTKIDATPVVTTASDMLGKKDIDEVALRNRFELLNFSDLPAVDSAIIHGGQVVVAVMNDIKFPLVETGDLKLEKFVEMSKAISAINSADAGAILTSLKIDRHMFVKPTVLLEPKKIVVGLGSKKEVDKNEVLDAIAKASNEAKIQTNRINQIATAEIKKDTPALNEAAKELGLPITYFSTDQLEAVSPEGLSPPSAIVKETVGVPGVAEQAAMCAVGNGGKLILKKMKFEGKITVAIAEGSWH